MPQRNQMWQALSAKAPAGKDGLLRFDPVITSTKGVERHHLFPKAYLSKKLGVADPKKIN